MGISYDLEVHQRLVRVSVVDPLDLHQIRSVVDELLLDPRLQRGFDVLSDHSELGTVATGDLVRGVVPLLRMLAERLGAFRCAVVAPRDASFGMARMAGFLVEPGGIEVRPFRSTTEAEAWLRPDGQAV